MEISYIDIKKVKPNKSNPRVIRDEKFRKLVRSIKEFPEMLRVRPIVVNGDMETLGGNMRLKACLEAGLKEVPVVKVSEWDVARQKEFVIKDNLGYGEWDWEVLANEWDEEKLEEWGLDVTGWKLDPAQMGDEFTLPDGDKAPFQQMTFTLADKQAEQIKNAIADIKQTEEYKYSETMGNENSNGNALYLIVSRTFSYPKAKMDLLYVRSKLEVYRWRLPLFACCTRPSKTCSWP